MSSNKHPKGLVVLALTNMGERFGYYTMLAILALYMQAKFGLSSATTSMIYGTFLALVYFLPVFGGIVADKALGYGRTIIIGVLIMFGGYVLLALPSDPNTAGKAMMMGALLLISVGTGLFKGNLQALVGKLYDDPRYSNNRDIAFSIFYMFINVGAFFAPSMANTINNAVLAKQNFTYDAAIPKNYVALNDKVVDEAAFMQELRQQHPGYDAQDAKEQAKTLKKAKAKESVMFKADKEEALFNLKIAGLHQLSKAGKLAESDPRFISVDDYKLMENRSQEPAILAEKQIIRERVNTAQITEESMLFGGAPQTFAQNFGKQYVSKSLSVSYSLSFAVACISLIISVLIFLLFRTTWKSADVTVKQARAKAAASNKEIKEMSKHEVRQRMIALFLVFAVVIFFWMAFHQNGLCLTFFARDYTQSSISPVHSMMFSLLTLIPFIVFMYGIYVAAMGLFGGKRNPMLGFVLILLGIAGLAAEYFLDIAKMVENIRITPQIFQQFNPFFIILLTPITVGIFTALNRRGKEPSAPRKIGIGMLLAALGFLVITVGSIGLPAPSDIKGTSDILVSPDWLIGTYFVLTIAELFLSPMGLSFVAKVAPPQYSGLMQGFWLAATAIGNLLVGVMGTFWEGLSLIAFWGVLIACCILSAVFIFSVMKKLESVTN